MRPALLLGLVVVLLLLGALLLADALAAPPEVVVWAPGPLDAPSEAPVVAV